MAKDDLDPDMRKKYAETLVSASNRLSGLVSNILKLNKLENQSIKPEFELINLTAQLSESIIAFEDIIEKKKLELDCDLDDVKIVSSSAHLELVWNNLISNAIKFTDEGGKISVSLKRLGNSVIVKISDSGCGISPEVGGRIFDKFYQGDTSRSSEGNGLGLALVKKVIDVIGGEISVTSQLGHGSMFTITLKENENA